MELGSSSSEGAAREAPLPLVGAPAIPPATTHDLDLTLMVACYNEEENIQATLDTLFAALDEAPCRHEVIVIDDASQDDSVAKIEEYARTHPERPIRLVVNDVNRGLAQNYIEGAFIGRGKYYRLVCGDDVEPKENFVTAIRSIGAAQIVIPYMTAIPGRALGRRILSRLYTTMVNVVTGNRLRYYNGLAIHTRYNVMRWHTDYRGFGFQADLITRLLDQGATYVEIPATSRERRKGQSKALTLHNLLSVAHMFIDLSIRRMGKILYGRRLSKPGKARPKSP